MKAKSMRSVMLAVLLMGTAALGQPGPAWHPITQMSGSTLNCPGEQEFAGLMKRALDGDAEAEDKVGTVLLSTCNQHKDKDEGLKWLQRSAEKGNVHAQLSLGQAYANEPESQDKAVFWLRKAAENGDARAQNDLGAAYILGKGVEQDRAQSLRWFRSAAEQDLPEAQYNLAVAYDRGNGVEQSYELARYWYKKSAEHHNQLAGYRLGLLFDQGLGGAKDQDAALRWFESAAADGSEDAAVRIGKKKSWESKSVDSGYFQYSIAEQLLENKESQKNLDQARAFLENAAEAGYPPAFLRLGGIYSQGIGVTRDDTKAMEYYEKARAIAPDYHAAYNSIAWLCLTSKDPGIHDVKKALEYSTKAVELSDHADGHDLDTLARAYFELGDIHKAVETETRAAQLEPKNEFIQKTLTDYRQADGAH